MTNNNNEKLPQGEQQGQVDLNIVLASMRDQIGLLSQEKAILYAQVLDLQEQLRATRALVAVKGIKEDNE
jgi:hypothetical protein